MTEALDNPFADRESDKPTRKKALGRKVAEQHADELIALMWPGAKVAKAGKQVTWIFDRAKGERFPIQRAEDICGVFDRVVFAPSGVVCIQATVHYAGASNVNERRNKIVREFIDPMVRSLGLPVMEREAAAAHLAAQFGPWLRIEVWGWERAKAMHTWRWSWADYGWGRDTSWRVKKGELVAEERTR